MTKKSSTFRFLYYATFCLTILLCTLLLITGCGKNKKKEYNGYYIYCLDTNETKVMGEEYNPTNSVTYKLIKELIHRMEKEPNDISFKKAIPDDVSLDDFVLSQKGDLSLYWSAAYGNYSGVSEILRRAAIVKTLCQIPDIDTVSFYVAGQPLTDSNLNAVGYMTADSFIDNTGEKAYTQNATLNMYYANESGKALVEVPVKLTYDASIPLEQLAIEQLLKGPDAIAGIASKRLLTTIPNGTKVNKISVKANTCYVDFSPEFMEKRANISDNVAIYSVVNTLVELSNINKVQFSIDGQQIMTYDDKIAFADPFERNLDIVTK